MKHIFNSSYNLGFFHSYILLFILVSNAAYSNNVSNNDKLYFSNTTSICIVTNTNDTGPGSLREAINCANANADYSVINFNIPGNGPHVIVTYSEMPIISWPLSMNGESQPGYNSFSKNPVIQIKADNSNNAQAGLVFKINSKGSEVKGIYLTNFHNYGLLVQADSIVIKNNVFNGFRDPVNYDAVSESISTGMFINETFDQGMEGWTNCKYDEVTKNIRVKTTLQWFAAEKFIPTIAGKTYIVTFDVQSNSRLYAEAYPENPFSTPFLGQNQWITNGTFQYSFTAKTDRTRFRLEKISASGIEVNFSIDNFKVSGDYYLSKITPSETAGIAFESLGSNSVVIGNKFGTDSTDNNLVYNVNDNNDVGIYISALTDYNPIQGLKIGSLNPNHKNIFSFLNKGLLLNSCASKIDISGNKFYGIANTNIFLGANTNKNKTSPQVSAYSNQSLTGTSVIKDRIELFESNATLKDAARYLGSTVSDASGNWSFDFSNAIGGAPALGTKIIATATDTLGNTSVFSGPFTVTGTTTAFKNANKYICEPGKYLVCVGNLTDRLIGYYPFDGDASDVSENGNHGIVSGAKLTEDRFGNPNSAYYFEGNDFITTGVKSLTGSELTISYWFKGSKVQGAVRQNSTVPLGYISSCQRDANGKPVHALFHDNGGQGGLSAGADIEDGEWHHVAFTWRRNITDGFKTYLDGNLIAQRGTVAGAIPNLNAFITFGLGSNGINTIGAIDDVAIYFRSLSPNDISYLYSNYSWSGPGMKTTSVTQSGAFMVGETSSSVHCIAKGPVKNGSATVFTVPVVLTTLGCNAPFNNTITSIPGKLEAENYDLGGKGIAYMDFTNGNNKSAYRNDDVDIEACLDEGGGFNIADVNPGEWLEYTIDVKKTAIYTFDIRAACRFTSKSLLLQIKGQSLKGAITIPNTGSNQEWTTIKVTSVPLDSGIQVLRILMSSDNIQFNYINVYEQDNSPFESVWQIPCKIEAEKYDNGGKDVAFFDYTSGNAHNKFRTDDVDIELCTDEGLGYNVATIAKDEWLEYTVNVPVTGKYNFAVRVSSITPGRSMHFEVDGQNITGPIPVPNTGNYQSWQTVEVKDIPMTKGTQVLRAYFDVERFNLNYFEVSYSKLSVNINTLNNRSFSYRFISTGIDTICQSPSEVSIPVNVLPVSASLKISSDVMNSGMDLFFYIDNHSNILNPLYSLGSDTSKFVLPTNTYKIVGNELTLNPGLVVNDLRSSFFPILQGGKYLNVNNPAYNQLKFSGISGGTGNTINLVVLNSLDEPLPVNTDHTWVPAPSDTEGTYKYKLTVNQKVFEGFFVLKR